MKAVLISIRPEWVEKIVSGKKTIEVRKTKPSIPTPFKCYIYCCKAKSQWRYSSYEGAYENSEGKIVYAQQHIIGEFICDKVISTCGWRLRGDTQQCAKRTALEEEFPRLACLTIDELVQYVGGDGRGIYGWNITDLKIYDKPKALWQFYKCGAKSLEELCDTGEICELCEYCQYSSHGLYLCKGGFCDEQYEAYLDKNFTLTRPPQSWCYVQDMEDNPNVF